MDKFACREVFNVLHAVRDWSAREIADVADVSVTTVNNWRNGKTAFPRIDKLAAVARVVGCRFALVPEGVFVKSEVSAPTPSRKRLQSSSEIRAN